MAILNNSNAISSGGYDVNNSLRFRSSASAYLNRTPASAGNRQIWTISVWVKRGTLGVDQKICSAYSADSDSGIFDLRFTAGNVLYFGYWTSAQETAAVYRDPSAWYHIVVAVDTTQATAGNRVKMYINGTQVTVSGAAFAQNTNLAWNNNVTQNIGRQARTSDGYFDGYLAEFNSVDGQALTPSSFGETDTTTGVWKPKPYSGTYGTNGFYLKFSDIAITSGSNAGLGKDFSGNGNYWTTNNISVTSGVTYDAMTDVPTNTSATVANYGVINPLSSGGSITNGNLTFSNSGAVKGCKGSFALESGKWYWENTITTVGATDLGVGIIFNGATDAMRDGTATLTYGVMYQANTNVRKNGTVVANYASYTTGDVIGIAYDADTRSITFYKNNTSQGSITADEPTSPYVALIMQPNTTSATVNSNFGQRAFSYTPPTGFVALNTYNLPTPTILQGNKYMDATLYTGNGSSSQVIVNNTQFKPDLVWVKSRSTANENGVYDTVRGANKGLFTNRTNAEDTSTIIVTALNSNGFTVGSDGIVNTNAATYVGWQWQAGQGSTSSNTSGSITSTVSVNTTAGFSVVTYTGTGANATVGHGLGVAPKMIVVKERSAVNDWPVYHSGQSATPQNGLVYLNGTNAYAAASTIWNNTAPTSTTFAIGTSGATNASTQTYVAYCWAAIPGFSAFGSYTGNGSADGTFVYTGFRPKFIIIKCSSTTGSWFAYDTTRNTYNTVNLYLNPDGSGAETAGSASEYFDILSNGFKQRVTFASTNGNGNTYIYMAFAENPFKNSLAR